MAYNNYLLKLGNYKIDEERFIALGTYQFYEEPLDLNSKRNLDGWLRRKVLDHVPIIAEFVTPKSLTNRDISELFSKIAENYIIRKERKLLVTAYNMEFDNYEEHIMYMVRPKFKALETRPDIVIHDSVQITLIGY